MAALEEMENMRKLRVSWVLVAFCGASAALGCATAPYEAARQPIGGNNVPPDVGYFRGSIDGAGGLKLHEQCWQPTRRARAAVVLVHDLKDHSSRYRDLGVSFANRGISVCAIDLRGHGYSEGVRDHLDSLENGIADLEILITRTRDREQGRPVFLLGQGFGATLAAVYALRSKTPVAGVILSNPLLREEVKRSERMGIRSYAILLPRSQRMDLDLRQYSSDQRVVNSLLNDVLIYRGKPTASTAGELLRASDEIRNHATALNVPLLVLLGGGDRIIRAAPVRALHEKAATSDKKLQTYDNLSHELFHEAGRTAVMNDVTDWIAAHSKEPEETVPEPASTAATEAAAGVLPDASAVVEKAPPAPARAKKGALRKAARRRGQ
jgi:acylglycerol lipase